MGIFQRDLRVNEHSRSGKIAAKSRIPPHHARDSCTIIHAFLQKARSTYWVDIIDKRQAVAEGQRRWCRSSFDRSRNHACGYLIIAVFDPAPLSVRWQMCRSHKEGLGRIPRVMPSKT
jgi:hypothetical protein